MRELGVRHPLSRLLHGNLDAREQIVLTKSCRHHAFEEGVCADGFRTAGAGHAEPAAQSHEDRGQIRGRVRVGDAATCTGPPDAIAKGAVTVLIG